MMADEYINRNKLIVQHESRMSISESIKLKVSLRDLRNCAHYNGISSEWLALELALAIITMAQRHQTCPLLLLEVVL